MKSILAGVVVLGVACAWGIVPKAQAMVRDEASPVPPCALRRPASRAYLQKIAKVARMLKVPPRYAKRYHLVVEPEAKALIAVEKDIYGYPAYLVPMAAAAFLAMQATAARDDVTLQVVSGYRSFAYQLGLIRRHLQDGFTIGQALRINDLPGYSEHQSGCAVDLTTPGVEPVSIAFATTAAYRWLEHHAARFGFRLTYGPHNRHHVEFEPWHWRFVQSREPSGSDGG